MTIGFELRRARGKAEREPLDPDRAPQHPRERPGRGGAAAASSDPRGPAGTPPEPAQAEAAGALVAQVIEQVGRVVLGKAPAVRLALASVLARGHLLIEDIPGVGKTTLAQVLARSLGLEFQRIQFTSDLLPADVLGVSVYDQGRSAFEFHPGPVFAQLVLADEVNRAPPKTQSALLEAMEEQQVTQDGVTRSLPEPFFVVATQNPSHQIGTFPLPESQLDRFLMRIRLGYPDQRAERTLLAGSDRREMLDALSPVSSAADVARLSRTVPQVHVSAALLDYLQALLSHSRESPAFALGLSPRAGLSLLRSAQAWALMAGRAHVLPEDVQAVLGPVCGHRLRSASGLEEGGGAPESLAQELLHAVPIP